jgi:hypothetical protein
MAAAVGISSWPWNRLSGAGIKGGGGSSGGGSWPRARGREASAQEPHWQQQEDQKNGNSYVLFRCDYPLLNALMPDSLIA